MSRRICIDARKLADFGIGTYIRNLLKSLAEIDRANHYWILVGRDGRSFVDRLGPNFHSFLETSTVYSLRELGTEAFGRPRPELVEPGEPTALADGEVYVPYFDMEVVFDDSRAREVLEPAGIRAPRLADCFGNLIDYAEAARWGKRPMSRQAARERREPAPA